MNRSTEIWWWHWLAARARVLDLERAFRCLEYSLLDVPEKECDRRLWRANMMAWQHMAGLFRPDPWVPRPLTESERALLDEVATACHPGPMGDDDYAFHG